MKAYLPTEIKLSFSVLYNSYAHKQAMSLKDFPRKDSTPNEFLEFREFSKTSAETCINSARAIIHLIVREYRSQDLIPNSPWWCLIHHLIPANKIIMLEMADENLHTPEYRAALLEDCKMVLVWLRSMSKVNTTLRRHSLELSDQLKQVAPGIDAQLGEEMVESGPQNLQLNLFHLLRSI